MSFQSRKPAVVKATFSSSRSSKQQEVIVSPELLQLRDECLAELVELRTQVANHNGLTNPETIVGINVLHGFSDSMPANIEEMMSTVGVTANWFEMWGDDFLQVFNFFSNLFVFIHSILFYSFNIHTLQKLSVLQDNIWYFSLAYGLYAFLCFFRYIANKNVILISLRFIFFLAILISMWS